MQISLSPNTQMIFGVDVDGLPPGQIVTVDERAYGYPVRSLRDVKAGRVFRAGRPPSLRNLSSRRRPHREAPHGSRRRPALEPGARQPLQPSAKITIGTGALTGFSIVLDQEIPPIPPPADTKYIRHIKIQSELLTKFWGRPMYLGANVLVPEGFDEHPQAHYPLIVFHDHFSRLRRLSRRAARSQSQARLQRALPHLRLQPHPAGRGVQVLPAVDRPQLSARADRANSSTPILTTTIPTP